MTILALGSNAALLAILGWLAKSFATHLLDKDVKRYEMTLKAQTDLALERFKSRLWRTRLTIRSGRPPPAAAELKR